jgi:hypothetical protein
MKVILIELFLFALLFKTGEQKIICNVESEESLDLNIAKLSVIGDENVFYPTNRRELKKFCQ